MEISPDLILDFISQVFVLILAKSNWNTKDEDSTD